MCRSALKANWDHTSALMAAIYNSRQGVTKTHWIDPVSLNPYRSRIKKQSGKMTIAQFARGFGK